MGGRCARAGAEAAALEYEGSFHAEPIEPHLRRGLQEREREREIETEIEIEIEGPNTLPLAKQDFLCARLRSGACTA